MTWTSTGNLAQAEVPIIIITILINDQFFDQVEFYASNSFEIVVSNAETNEAIQFNYNHQVRRNKKLDRFGERFLNNVSGTRSWGADL